MKALFGQRLLAVTLLAMTVDAHLGNAAEITLDLAIKDRQLPQAMRTIKVQEGDTVRLRLSADRSMILHLHGYDIEKRVGPGAVAEMAFTANATGRFPLEVHSDEQQGPIAYVEVYPR